MSNDFQDVMNRLIRLETFTGVDDPDGGLRRDIKELRVALRGLEKGMRGIELRMYFAMGAVAVIVWALERTFEK